MRLALRCLTRYCSFWLFFSTIFLQTVKTQAFDCGSICFSEYSVTFNPDCELLTYVLQCYNDHVEDCENNRLAMSSINRARTSFDIKGCPPLPTPVTTTESAAETAQPPLTTETPAASTCPIMVPPYIPGTSAPSLTAPEISPISFKPACAVQDDPLDLQHCSVFGFSNYRPFQLYGSGLGACNIPGSRYMLKHPAVTVQVEGLASGENCDHTRLTRVNVTFYKSDEGCLEATKSYVASEYTLPRTFTDNTVPNNTNSNLQFYTDLDGTQVSLLATWINISVVIRSHTDLLAVTLQVPETLAQESEGGLCKGCPADKVFNMLEYNLQMATADECTDENIEVATNCFFGFSNRPEFEAITSATYADVCIYSLWRANSTSYDVLSFLGAVANDAKLLSDIQQKNTSDPPTPFTFPDDLFRT